MLVSDYKGQNCSVARALEVVGERWTLLIVRDLLAAGPLRFGELQHNLGVARNVLTDRLEKLVALGVIERHRYSEAREWYRYQLTEKGRELYPVISALMAWGDRHAAPDGPPAVIRHVDCGHPAGHAVVCAHCHGDLDARSVRLTAGPGAARQSAS